MQIRLNTTEKTDKTLTTDELALSSAKPLIENNIKNDFSTSDKQNCKPFNQENINEQLPTLASSLLYSSLPNYNNELTNKELSTEKYCYYFFGYYKAVCYLKCVENKLKEGLKLNFNKRDEILKHLPENYIDLKGNQIFFSESQLLQNFDNLPADLFVSTPKISGQFSKDFMKFMFFNLHTDNYTPKLLEHELRQVQLKINCLKTKFNSEISVIDLIGQPTFHIGSYEVSDISKYDEFIHLFREANIIKKQIIKFEVDNELTRKLITSVNNLLKILNNYVYYKEVFLEENNLVVSSRNAEDEAQKNFKAKVISLSRSGETDSNSVSFNTTETKKKLKKTIVEKPIIQSAAKKKLIERFQAVLASSLDIRYNTDYKPETIEKKLYKNVNFGTDKKYKLELINSELDINMNISQKKGSIYPPIVETPFTNTKYKTYSDIEIQKKRESLNRGFIEIYQQKYKTHYNPQHEVSPYNQQSGIKRFKIQQNTDCQNNQLNKTHINLQKNIAEPNTPQDTEHYYTQNSTSRPQPSDFTSRYNPTEVDVSLNSPQNLSDYKASVKTLNFNPTNITFRYSSPQTASHYGSSQKTSNHNTVQKTTQSNRPDNTTQNSIPQATTNLNRSRDTSALNISRGNDHPDIYKTSNLNNLSGTDEGNANRQVLSNLGPKLPRLYQLYYHSYESKGTEKQFYDTEIVRTIFEIKDQIYEFLIATRNIETKKFTKEELNLLCKTFNICVKGFTSPVVTRLITARGMLKSFYNTYLKGFQL
ncbi:hypothetical protein CDIK_1256 [Cucumispora dikerogammari]|nr:hypothetical protein CDIK_1256 [Cucumispora dikerogammari]